MSRPETTLPNPNVYINSGKPIGPPPRPSPEIMVSTGVRSAGMGDGNGLIDGFLALPAGVLSVVLFLFVVVVAPVMAWMGYFAAHLPIWAWYASLFPH